MPETGEVRDFATGFMESVPSPSYPGVYTARMQVEQRVWTGTKWADYSDPDATTLLGNICKDRWNKDLA